MNYIVLDMEWNQPLCEEMLVRKPVIMYGEIIQIGAVKLDENFIVTDVFDMIVMPKYYRKMHKKVSELTGITNETLRCGLPFPIVFEKFQKWCGEDFAIMTWGCDDVGILRVNMEIYGIDVEWIPDSYNLQAIFAGQIMKERKQVSLLDAMQMLNEPPLDAHDALNDAKNTARICLHMDMFQGLANYSTIKNYYECSSGEFLERFKPEKHYEKPADALSDPENLKFCCPECKKVVTCDGLVFQNASRFMAWGKCVCEKEYLIRFKLKRADDKKIEITRLLYPMTEQSRKYYEEKKNVKKVENKTGTHRIKLSSEEKRLGVLEKVRLSENAQTKYEILANPILEKFCCPCCHSEVKLGEYYSKGAFRGVKQGKCDCKKEYYASFNFKKSGSKTVVVRRIYEMDDLKKKSMEKNINVKAKFTKNPLAVGLA